MQNLAAGSKPTQLLEVIALQVKDLEPWAKIEGFCSQGGKALLSEVKVCKLREKQLLGLALDRPH